MKAYFADHEEMQKILGMDSLEFGYLARALDLPQVVVLGTVKYIVPLVTEKLNIYFKGDDRCQFPARGCNLFDHAMGEVSAIFKNAAPVDDKVTEWVAKTFASSTVGYDESSERRFDACIIASAKISNLIRHSDFFEFMLDKVKMFSGQFKHDDPDKLYDEANWLLGELCVMMKVLNRLYIEESKLEEGGFSPTERERIFDTTFDVLEIPIVELLRKITRAVSERDEEVIPLSELIKKYSLCMAVYQGMIDLQVIYDEEEQKYLFFAK